MVPLARGLLAGTRRSLDDKASTERAGNDGLAQVLYSQPSDWDVVEAVRAVAKARGDSMAQVARAWLLTRPAVTAPIIGATKLGHLDDAIAAVDLELSAEERAALEAPYQPHPVRGHGRAMFA